MQHLERSGFAGLEVARFVNLAHAAATDHLVGHPGADAYAGEATDPSGLERTVEIGPRFVEQRFALPRAALSLLEPFHRVERRSPAEPRRPKHEHEVTFETEGDDGHHARVDARHRHERTHHDRRAGDGEPGEHEIAERAEDEHSPRCDPRVTEPVEEDEQKRRCDQRAEHADQPNRRQHCSAAQQAERHQPALVDEAPAA